MNATALNLPAPVAALASAAVATALGMAAAGLGYGAFGAPDDVGLVDPPLWPVRWMFWTVWLVLYPTIGVAGSKPRNVTASERYAVASSTA